MAISWNVDITNVNVNSKRADITFTRTDDQSALAPWVHPYKSVIIETGPQRAALLNQVWSEWQDEISKQAAIDAFITDMEQAGKANLEARET
jgi:hypothetical protein